MRLDLRTKMTALSRSEVEKLNPSGESVTVQDWQRWPEPLSGYVVHRASPRPFRNPRTGEGIFDEPKLRRQLVVRAERGLVALWELDGLGELFDRAEIGAPLEISFSEGRFDVALGEPDVEPEGEPQPSRLEAERLEAAAVMAALPDPEVEQAEKEETARLAAAEGLLRPRPA